MFDETSASLFQWPFLWSHCCDSNGLAQYFFVSLLMSSQRSRVNVDEGKNVLKSSWRSRVHADEGKNVLKRLQMSC